MQHTVSLIPQAFTYSESTKVHLPPSPDALQSKLLAPDAFDNPEHLKFALRGCLAASGCYIIYNSIAWPSIGAPAYARRLPNMNGSSAQCAAPSAGSAVEARVNR